MSSFLQVVVGPLNSIINPLLSFVSIIWGISARHELIEALLYLLPHLTLELAGKLLLATDFDVSQVQKEKVFVLVDMLSYKYLEHTSELVYTHAKQVDCLDEGLDDSWLEEKHALARHQHLIDHLKDDVLHRRTVKGFNH